MSSPEPDRSRGASSVELSGPGWRLRGSLPSAWHRPDADDPALGGDTGWIRASVPGSVQLDLQDARLLDDVYSGRNTLAAEWAADRTWTYERTFEGRPEWRGATMRLRFERVDYAARVLLNGTLLGEHASIFTPAVFDATDAVRCDGENRLTVVLAPAPEEQDQLGRTSLVRTRKTRMGYWWDFCPRLVNLGLGGPVSLELSLGARLEDVAVHPQLSADRRSCAVRVELDLSAGAGNGLRAEVDLLHRDVVVATASAALAPETERTTTVVDAAIADPALWWPNGAGDQSLYRADVRLLDASTGSVLDRRSVDFGVRRIELAPNDTSDPAAPPYTFVVNGRRIYANGWNWVPVDALYGAPRPEKTAHLLELAAAASCNLLRVNGVGLIESRDFYEQCDRLGIMVWQEFVLTSSATDRKPAEDPDYLGAVVAEARDIVRSRRNHPSLVLWCAGNELESLEKLPLDDSEPIIGALREVARELDPDTVWLPTSARGRKPFNGLSSIRRDPDGLHDVHGPWLYEGLTAQYELYNAGTSLFHSELGAEAITNPETLGAVLPAEEGSVERMETPTWRHLSAWWVRPDVWRAIFGPVDDLARLVAATQFLQAEGVRYGVESNRRRAWRNSGSLPWQFNEPYPMVGSTAAVDYYGRPKPLYYAIAQAYAPVAVSARYDTLAWGGRTEFAAELWAASARAESLPGSEVVARVLSPTGTVLESVVARVDVDADGPTLLGRISCPLDRVGDGLFLLDITLGDGSGAPVAAQRLCFSAAADLAPLVRLPEGRATAQLHAGGEAVTVTNTGEQPLLAVRIADARDVREGPRLRVEDAFFSLLPAESRTLRLVWRDAPPEDRRLTISGLNLRPLAAGPAR